MLLFSSRANQISTKVKMNQTANRIAVMMRFLRQYSWCLADSSNQASPQNRNYYGFLLGWRGCLHQNNQNANRRGFAASHKSEKEPGVGGRSGIRTHETSHYRARSAAVREPCRVVDAHHRLCDVVVKLLGRAHLFLAATGAFVERHFDLDLERRQFRVFQLVRKHLPALGLRSEFLAAFSAEVLFEE